MIHEGLEPRTVPFGDETRIALTGYQMRIRKPAIRWKGWKRFEVCPICGHESPRRRDPSRHDSNVNDISRAREVNQR